MFYLENPILNKETLWCYALQEDTDETPTGELVCDATYLNLVRRARNWMQLVMTVWPSESSMLLQHILSCRNHPVKSNCHQHAITVKPLGKDQQDYQITLTWRFWTRLEQKDILDYEEEDESSSDDDNISHRKMRSLHQMMTHLMMEVRAKSNLW